MSELKIKKVTVAAKKTALKSGRTLRTAGSREKEEISKNPPDPQRYAIRQDIHPIEKSRREGHSGGHFFS